uniref:Protein tiptop n=1 Tax=Cacopsylla melanoneura TaxID=428564 RepID=A0A8D9AI71_9HEMI
MSRRKQNCPKRMKWEGGEGEEPPPDFHPGEEDGDHSGDQEEDDEDEDDRGSSAPHSPLSLVPPTHPGPDYNHVRDVNSPSRHSGDSSIPPRSGSRESAFSDRGVSPPYAMHHSAPHSPSDDPNTAVLDLAMHLKRPGSTEPVLNLSKSIPLSTPNESLVNSPLDLSCSTRKRSREELSPSPTSIRKTSRISNDFKPQIVTPWTSPVVPSHFPFFAAAAAAAGMSPNNLPASLLSTENPLWNGKMKQPEKNSFNASSDATKALEKMSELSKLGGDEFRPHNTGGRHSAWQSHWLNKGADQAKDVLKCVWCKQSFPSLAALTTHMKEAKHCGVNIPPPAQPNPLPPPQVPTTTSINTSPSNTNSKADLNLLIKETMPLPRKLVRGQDVWLGKGAEQTRQILKCMWCGQSFRSLAEMTSHMQQTQHYTNIISQEQIISWKSADGNSSTKESSDAKANNTTNSNTTTNNTPPTTTNTASTGSTTSSGSGSGAGSGAGTPVASSHVSAVLTCKVCDQAFSSLKELSNHMVKNSHYKEHIMRSITESGGRRRQTREKRKKSLPVRKLLEIERAQNDMKNGDMFMGGMVKPGRESAMHSVGRISCEKCGEKIDMAVFVDHIRLCIGGDQRNLLKSALLSSENQTSVTQALRESRKIKREESQTPTDGNNPADLSTNSQKDGKSSSPSVLNAIEKLIEKSFDSRSRHGGYVGQGGAGNAPIGSSILKRLGIDESVDYTKPLVDAQTMNLLRNYQQQQFGMRRERSGSESSSMSERGLGRPESLTPDKKFDISSERHMSSTPRTTPDKPIHTPPSGKPSVHDDSTDDEMNIKKEPLEPEDMVIKKEKMENGDDDDKASYRSGSLPRSMSRTPPPVEVLIKEERRSHSPPSPGRHSMHAPSPRSSPANSDRSTPRSTHEKKSTGSLGALSSMFDSLSGGPSNANSNETNGPGGKSSHPLAALQKLCDKTETHHPNANNSNTRPNSNSGPSNSVSPSNLTTTSSGTTPGAILAFSWACNDAVMTADSIMKCAFCDTPFISKGAYRHHLSKMHFVKDGVIPDPVNVKSQTPSPSSSKAMNPPNSFSSAAKSPPQNFEESPHSKFLKYTELAKQLSSKYV